MAKVEIIMLGTSAGIPTRQRAHPSIFLTYKAKNEFCYLLDCGEGTQRQILFAGLNPMKLNEIFITHWHGDHYLGLPGLIDTMGFENREKPLTIYAPEAERIKRILNWGYPSKKFEIIPKDIPAKGKKITTLLETENFKIISVPVEHNIPAVAYALVEKDSIKIDKEKAKKIGLPSQGIIYREIKEKGEITFKNKKIKLEEVSFVKKGKRIVYSGDTKICENLAKLAKDADLLIQDCTYFDFSEEFKEYGHASLKDIIDMVKKTKIRKVILTHISRRYKSSTELKKQIKNYPSLTLAEDFMKVVI